MDTTDILISSLLGGVNSGSSGVDLSLSGTEVFNQSGMAMEKNISTIENLTDYSVFAIYMTGEGYNNIPFAVSGVIPLKYLMASYSNSFEIAGGLPSGENEFAGYITATMPTSTKLRLRVSDTMVCMRQCKIVALF